MGPPLPPLGGPRACGAVPRPHAPTLLRARPSRPGCLPSGLPGPQKAAPRGVTAPSVVRNTCAGAPPTFRVLIQVCPGLLQLPGDQPVSVLIGGCSSVLSSREDQRGSESTSVPYHSSTVHISRNIRGRGNSCSSSCCFCAPWTTRSLELL